MEVETRRRKDHPPHGGSFMGVRALSIYAVLAASLAVNYSFLRMYFLEGPITKRLEDSTLPFQAKAPEAPLTASLADAGFDVASLFEFPGEERCGRWSSNYKAFHQSIRAGKVPGKYITFVPSAQMGIAAKLTGIATTFVAALLLNRVLIINDTDLLDLVDPLGIDWRVGDDVPLNVTARGIAGQNPALMDATNGSVLYFDFTNLPPSWFRKNIIVFPATNMLEFFAPYSAAANFLVETDAGVIFGLLSQKGPLFDRLYYDMGMRLRDAFGCIIRFLMRPKRSVWKPVEAKLKRFRNPNRKSICIGLYDDVINQVNAEHLTYTSRALLNCAVHIEFYWFPASWRFSTWLVASNSPLPAKIATDIYGKKAESTQLLKTHRESEMFASWLLFSTCDYYAIVDSLFAKSAFAYNMWDPRLFLSPPMSVRPKQTGMCNASIGQSIVELRDWYAI